MSRVMKNMKPMTSNLNKSLKLSVVCAGIFLTGCASYQKDHFTLNLLVNDLVISFFEKVNG